MITSKDVMTVRDSINKWGGNMGEVDAVMTMDEPLIEVYKKLCDLDRKAWEQWKMKWDLKWFNDHPLPMAGGTWDDCDDEDFV